MKKRILSMLLCCLMLFGLVFTVSADPDQPEVDPVAHAITVTTENGTATASAETAVAGTEITLTAEANEGFRFLKWEVVEGQIEIADDKFVMPDTDVVINAVFEKIPVEHKITVKPSKMGKAYSNPKTAIAGTEIVLTAEPDSGYFFAGWKVVEGDITIASDKFIMPDEDVVIEVIFSKESAIKVTTDGNGEASADKATAVNGEEITLTATPKEGYAFKEWQVIKGNVEIKDNKFIMPDEDVEIKAIFAAEHKIVVLTDKNGTASASATDAIAGTEIVLTAKGNDGYYFKEWQVIRGNVEIKDNKFVMPDEDVTVKAIFAEIKDAPNDDDMNVKRDIHFVLVKTDGNGVGVAYPPYSEAGTKVTVVAIAKPGYKFKEWKVVKGGVELENKKIASFVMPAENVILEAIFESDGTEGDKPTLPDIPKPDFPKPDKPNKPEDPSTPSTPEAPSNPEAPEVPDTGDNTNVLLWVAAMVLGGGAAISTVVVSKKKKEEN